MKSSIPVCLPVLSALVLFSSCVKENGAVESGDGAADVKIVRLSDDVVQDAVLVKFSSAPGGEQLSSLSASEGVTLRRVFTSTPGKEELEARFGLDRWYEAALPEGVDIHRSVRSLAARRDVTLVQYQSVGSRESDGVSYGVSSPSVKGVSASFNDPLLSDQWHYQNFGSRAVSPTAVKGADINVTDVWSQLTCGDPSIVVAVVDEGVKYSHPDLRGNMWVNAGEIPGNGIDDDKNGYIDDVYGYNFVDGGPITWDKDGDVGHGTHCAGTIAAVNNNGRGVAGVAGGSGNGDGCRIMSCQVFSGETGGSAKIISQAIKYAADMGASIISCSLGYSTSFASDNAYIKSQGSVEIDAIHYFEASRNNDVLDGGIAVFAAGNENHNYAHYPGAFNDIISVSAFGPDLLPAYYTNYGPGCNISAPGGEAYHKSNVFKSMILSTFPSELEALTAENFYKSGQDYGYMQGTSMACPHVSGVVALGLSYAKQLGKKFTREEFKRMILASVNDIDQRIGTVSSKSYAYGHADLPMSPYYHQMGTGAIDAWRLMMHIEGLPTLTAQTGREQWIDLTRAFGTASVSLTYLSVEVEEATVNSLGLQKAVPTNTSDKYPAVEDAGGYAYVQFGRLYIHPTKIGSGKIKITAVGGGDHLGGGDNPPGGMEISQEVSVIAREAADGGNGTGGWL